MSGALFGFGNQGTQPQQSVFGSQQKPFGQPQFGSNQKPNTVGFPTKSYSQNKQQKPQQKQFQKQNNPPTFQKPNNQQQNFQVPPQPYKPHSQGKQQFKQGPGNNQFANQSNQQFGNQHPKMYHSQGKSQQQQPYQSKQQKPVPAFLNKPQPSGQWPQQTSMTSQPPQNSSILFGFKNQNQGNNTVFPTQATPSPLFSGNSSPSPFPKQTLHSQQQQQKPQFQKHNSYSPQKQPHTTNMPPQYSKFSQNASQKYQPHQQKPFQKPISQLSDKDMSMDSGSQKNYPPSFQKSEKQSSNSFSKPLQIEKKQSFQKQDQQNFPPKQQWQKKESAGYQNTNIQVTNKPPQIEKPQMEESRDEQEYDDYYDDEEYYGEEDGKEEIPMIQKQQNMASDFQSVYQDLVVKNNFCKFHLSGSCKRGTQCNFSHDDAIKAQIQKAVLKATAPISGENSLKVTPKPLKLAEKPLVTPPLTIQKPTKPEQVAGQKLKTKEVQDFSEAEQDYDEEEPEEEEKEVVNYDQIATQNKSKNLMSLLGPSSFKPKQETPIGGQAISNAPSKEPAVQVKPVAQKKTFQASMPKSLAPKKTLGVKKPIKSSDFTDTSQVKSLVTMKEVQKCMVDTLGELKLLQEKAADLIIPGKAELMKMCNDQEIDQRREEHALNQFEMDMYGEGSEMYAIKAYSRPAADKTMNEPTNIRPSRILFQCVKYLKDCIADQDLLEIDGSDYKYVNPKVKQHSFMEVYNFFRDRQRSIAQDFIILNKFDDKFYVKVTQCSKSIVNGVHLQIPNMCLSRRIQQA